MGKVLISLVSEQTIPNVEFILEHRQDIDRYIFITSDKIRKEGQMDWIINCCNLCKECCDEVLINPFNIKDIEQKLRDLPLSDEHQYFVNITGGTKLTVIVFAEFFKSIGAKIYYLTGYDKDCIKIFPAFGDRISKIKTHIDLDTYLKAYGLDIRSRGELLKKEDYVNSFMEKYLNADFGLIKPALSDLQKLRNTKRSVSVLSIPQLNSVLNYFEFESKNEGQLNKHEIRFLTGDWLEEYVYLRVKNELDIDDKDIGIGYQIRKGDVPNEFDVLFVYQNKIYTIECKTGITYKQLNSNGKLSEKNLLAEILYKSDSLKHLFGLFVNTSVLTLSSLRDENNNYLPKYENHIKRAEMNRIKIISKADIVVNTPIKELLKIK